jgi:hypothetical protein
MLRLKFALLAGILLSSIPWGQPTAAAATLKAVSAPVSVNSGEGFRQVVSGTIDVSVGTQVMAGPGGKARIVYADGCVTDVNPGAVVTVGKCYTPMRAGLEEPIEEERRHPWLLYGAAAAVIGVGICVAADCFDHDDDGRPRPPKSP